MKVTREYLANAQDASTSFNSSNIYLNQDFGYSIQVVVTGSVTGTLKLQGSDDIINILHDSVGAGVVTWTDITGSPQAISGAGHGVYNVSAGMYEWLRASYAATSGTGTMTIIAIAKGI